MSKAYRGWPGPRASYALRFGFSTSIRMADWLLDERDSVVAPACSWGSHLRGNASAVRPVVDARRVVNHTA